jgi:mannitol-1-phosphate/altronate dehydrogenase
MKAKRQKEADKLTAYNAAVKAAYFKILKRTRQLLSMQEEEQLRNTLHLFKKPKQLRTLNTVHEFISPVVYLSLECVGYQKLSICFGFEQLGVEHDFSTVTGPFMRMLYHFTAKEHTPINIQECINTDYVFTHCTDLFASIASCNTHTLKLLPYKSQSK